MNIENKYKLKDTVFINDDRYIVCKVACDYNNEIDYLLWYSKNNSYDWYDEWQIQDKPNIIWFKENNDEWKNKT